MNQAVHWWRTSGPLGTLCVAKEQRPREPRPTSAALDRTLPPTNARHPYPHNQPHG